MDFYDVLERVLKLLQQLKRMTYRALQRQLAVDEDGRVLAWPGAVGTAPASALPLLQVAPQPSALDDSPPHDTPSPTSGNISEDRVRIAAYQVQEMGGRVWAYLGPEPTPLLPRLELCERDHELCQIVRHMLPCNWLQVMENRGDQPHGIYLHGRLFQYALERQGRLTDDPSAHYHATMRQQEDRMKRGAYPVVQIVPNKYGFTKGMRDSDAPEDVWQLGGPVFFPYLVYPNGSNSGSIRHDYQIGVPIDDTTTWHISYRSYTFPPKVTVPQQECIPYVEVPLRDAKGEYILDYVLGQDMVAWYEQG